MSLLVLFHGEGEAPPAPATVPFFITEPETLSVRLEVTGGQSLAFGPDREDEGEIPLSIEWSTQNPGGFADGATTLTRPAWISAADAPLMASYRVENQGGELRYQGRVKATPQVDATTIRIEAEGLAAALDDNEYWRFLGVHNDLSAWEGPSIQRQNDIFDDVSAAPISDGGATNDETGLPAVATTMQLPADTFLQSEQWLRVDGIPIGWIVGSWRRDSILLNDDNAQDYSYYVSLGSSDTAQTYITSELSGGTTFSLQATSTLAYHAALSMFAGNPSAAVGVEGPRTAYWVPSVFGTHGLTQQALPDGRWGLLDQDIIEYAVSNGAPEIPMSAGFIDSNGFTVPHVVHTGTVRELIEQITVYGGTGGRLNDWGVFEAFFHRAPGWGETWRVRRDEVEFSEGGPTAEGRCNAVAVTYTDGAGRELSVGWPGSGADFETSDLLDDSPPNPSTRAIVREGGLTSQQGAINIGVAALAEANAENRRSQVTITDTVSDSAGNERPASAVRACDYVVVEDEEGGYPPEIQPIVGTSYNHDSLSVSCELGLPAPSVEALLARLAARTPG